MIRQAEPTTWSRVLAVTWYILVCGVFLSVGSFAGLLTRSKFISFRDLLIPPKPQEAFHADVQTFLILGCDQDVYYHNEFVLKHAARSDMMLVARMDFAKGEITGVSIPRDTWCQLPGFPEHKINAYHSIAKFGKENELTKQAVEYLIGVPIDQVIVIDYDAMQKMVDLLGGVPVNVPRKMDYDDNAGKLHIHLNPGYQKLDGYNAMCYVRFRHSNDKKLTETDFQRQQREKDLLLGLKQAAMANLAHLPEIADAGRAVLGGELSDEQIKSLIFFAKGIGPQKIRLGVIPTKEDGKGLRLEADKLAKVLQEYNLGDNATRVTLR